jgi:hypothetical protein
MDHHAGIQEKQPVRVAFQKEVQMHMDRIPRKCGGLRLIHDFQLHLIPLRPCNLVGMNCPEPGDVTPVGADAEQFQGTGGNIWHGQPQWQSLPDDKRAAIQGAGQSGAIRSDRCRRVCGLFRIHQAEENQTPYRSVTAGRNVSNPMQPLGGAWCAWITGRIQPPISRCQDSDA